MTVHDVKGLEETDGGALKCLAQISERGRHRTIVFFVPLKLIDDDSEVYAAGTEGDLVIPQWLAEDNHLI